MIFDKGRERGVYKIEMHEIECVSSVESLELVIRSIEIESLSNFQFF